MLRRLRHCDDDCDDDEDEQDEKDNEDNEGEDDDDHYHCHDCGSKRRKHPLCYIHPVRATEHGYCRGPSSTKGFKCVHSVKPSPWNASFLMAHPKTPKPQTHQTQKRRTAIPTREKSEPAVHEGKGDPHISTYPY